MYQRTLQADMATTAERLSLITPQVRATDVSVPTTDTTDVPGDPLASRTGLCPKPAGYNVQNRLGFCLSIPSDWSVANVDGGLAAKLNTTPGQAISIKPAWAESTAVCNLMLYIAAERSVQDHLESRHNEFESQSATTALSPIMIQSLGSMAMPGFTWEIRGVLGQVYADVVGAGRIAHISFSGTNCSVNDLLPVLETLRFNSSGF